MKQTQKHSNSRVHISLAQRQHELLQSIPKKVQHSSVPLDTSILHGAPVAVFGEMHGLLGIPFKVTLFCRSGDHLLDSYDTREALL